MDRVLELILNYLCDRCCIDIGADENLLDNPHFSSFDLVNLVIEMERAYPIEITEDYMRVENFLTPAKIASMVKKLIAAE